MAVRDVNHDANVIAELDATCMSFPRGAIQPSYSGPARPFGRLRDFGGRSCGKLLRLLLKVEAAGIEPGQLDDLGAVSRRHLAQVRDPPREMSGLRALSRATKANSADSVDQRDHGGFVRRNLRLGNEAVRHQRFFLSEHESPRSCDFLHVFRERYRAPGSTNVHADSRVSCAQRVPRSRPNTGRASLDVVQVAALLGCSTAHVYDLRERGELPHHRNPQNAIRFDCRLPGKALHLTSRRSTATTRTGWR